MILAILLLLVTGYCVLVVYRMLKRTHDEATAAMIDPDGIYCICDYKMAPDGSLSLCGEELDPLDPDIPFELIPPNQNCATCVRIEQLIKEGQ